MEAKVREVFADCRECLQFSKGTRKYPLRSLSASYPSEKVVLDTAHITTSGGRKEYFLVAINFFTKWVEVKAVGAETGYQIAQFIKEGMIFRHGCPELILSDNGSLYVSAKVNEMYTKWNVRHVTLAVYHPESNGLAKQTIQTLKASMERLFEGSLSNWKTHLAYAVMANWMMTHWSTGYSPFMMMYSREALVSLEAGRYRY